MGGEDEVQVSEAQEFCVGENDWLVGQCQFALSKYGVPNPKDSGRDLAQVVYLKCAAVDNERWRAIEHKRAYVAALVRHAAYDFYRRGCREIATDSGAPQFANYTEPRTPVVAEEAAIFITELMKFLSPEERQLLAMLYEGLSGEEIAERLGTSHDAARKRVERLRKKLQQTLNEEKFPFRTSGGGGNAQGP